jgi:hypothetical protein
LFGRLVRGGVVVVRRDEVERRPVVTARDEILEQPADLVGSMPLVDPAVCER